VTRQSALSPDNANEPVQDDPEIPDDEILYRRLSYDGGDWLANTDPVRPASGGFQPDADGLSVYRHSILASLTPPLNGRAVAIRPGDVVVGFTVRDVRASKLGVKDDPWPNDVVEPDHPRNAAHALIVGWDGLGKNARVRRQRDLTRLPSLAFI
jgi:hypothetical protein